MKRRNLRLVWSVVLALAIPFTGDAKGYSSGSHSYSSHSSSSSRSSSSGGGRSFSSSSSRSSSGSSSRSSSSSGSSRSSSTKSFSSGGGKSYSSGSSGPGDRKGYSSSKSYSSGSGSTFSSRPKDSGSSKVSKPSSSSSSGSSGFSFDQSAARARKEEASKSDYSRFKDSQKPPVIPRTSGNDYSASPPPIRNSTRSYTRTVYVPDYTVIQTRPSRINVYFGSYGYRPWVYYHDPYSSLFWWWLLDRSIDEQAYWAYHHRYDMDPARYDALMTSNQQLQARVATLEAQQVDRDPSYTPPSLSTNRDLMYSDQYVNQAYQTRPTSGGRAAFWIFAVPACVAFCGVFIWLIWFKRWQVNTA